MRGEKAKDNQNRWKKSYRKRRKPAGTIRWAYILSKNPIFFFLKSLFSLLEH